MEASAPGSRRASHRLTASFLSNAGSAEPSIPICLSSAPTTFFTICRWTVEMHLVPRLHFRRVLASFLQRHIVQSVYCKNSETAFVSSTGSQLPSVKFLVTDGLIAEASLIQSVINIQRDCRRTY